AMMDAKPLATWKNFLKYYVVSNHASLLSPEIDDANFAFYGTALNGQPEQRDRWKRGVRLVGSHGSLGEALGKLYVERHFPPESKKMVEALVGNLKTALRERINTLDWMSDATKKEALAKLDAFRTKIGYPDKWRDFSSIKISRDDLIGNAKAVGDYWYQDMVDDLGRPTDRDEWEMTPQTVNAYYHPLFNEIVFPAAILQPPLFDPAADPAVNYGAIGAVIGHEMGHGFDDQGSKFDAVGSQRNWWTDEDRTRFDNRTKVLVDQYAAFEALPGQNVNGELTLGENIGDLGGLSMAYRAYHLSLDGKDAPVLDGLTGDQRFFLSWAQIWKGKERESYTLQRIKADPHSPGKFRVNGVVRNMDAWYKAFDIKPDNKLYLPPDQRVNIW
ncbi:M13 family peptidase, partial [bacterium]|nr:M13 family peptidase [bacterium]